MDVHSKIKILTLPPLSFPDEVAHERRMQGAGGAALIGGIAGAVLMGPLTAVVLAGAGAVSLNELNSIA